jgi:hypothetical protein
VEEDTLLMCPNGCAFWSSFSIPIHPEEKIFFFSTSVVGFILAKLVIARRVKVASVTTTWLLLQYNLGLSTFCASSV